MQQEINKLKLVQVPEVIFDSAQISLESTPEIQAAPVDIMSLGKTAHQILEALAA